MRCWKIIHLFLFKEGFGQFFYFLSFPNLFACDLFSKYSRPFKDPELQYCYFSSTKKHDDASSSKEDTCLHNINITMNGAVCPFVSPASGLQRFTQGLQFTNKVITV